MDLTPFDPWRAAHRRTAYRPVIGPGPSTSHFGGAPLLAPTEDWPTCAVCGKPMPLFVQVDLANAPDPEDAVLQVFYCTDPDCEQQADGWGPFSDCHLQRVVDRANRSEPPPVAHAFPVRAIVGWDPHPDLPDPEDHRNHGIDYVYDWTAKTVVASCPSIGVSVRASLDQNLAESLARALPGDKLGGWPTWVQRDEYPECPKCGDRMAFVLQLDSEDHVPWMFGDLGVATLTRCRAHPDVLGFGWACG